MEFTNNRKTAYEVNYTGVPNIFYLWEEYTYFNAF